MIAVITPEIARIVLALLGAAIVLAFLRVVAAEHHRRVVRHDLTVEVHRIRTEYQQTLEVVDVLDVYPEEPAFADVSGEDLAVPEAEAEAARSAA